MRHGPAISGARQIPEVPFPGTPADNHGQSPEPVSFCIQTPRSGKADFRVVGIFLLIILFAGCVKSYNPPAILSDYHYLVVQGSLVSSPDSPTVITLSRTVQLSDTTASLSVETGARVEIADPSGALIPLTEIQPGQYEAAPTVLNPSQTYQLKITTSNGVEYASDFVPVLQTPPIDSINWLQPGDLTIYANSHDPTGNIHNFRWDYQETWQYRAHLDREVGVDNGLMYYTDSTHQTYNCWISHSSSDILLGSTVALSQDQISGFPLLTIPQNSQKLSVRYSILVKQYALTDSAFQYLGVLKKNTENLGSIFDAQPTQLIGNFHSVTHPSETVIGYLTASTVSQQRIFISHSELHDWNYAYTGRYCDSVYIPQNPSNYLLYNYPDTSYSPYYI
ncbi:MAG: DUF4249 domain-containing protein, partial [Bacteroidota bacterium]|nr:DUF4249 domain-containing protein [Bacteroidota bacterium]